MKKEELFNQRFENWLVLDKYMVKNKKTYYECICDCGIKKYVLGADLKAGKSKRCFSCGTIHANKQKNSIPLTNTFWGKVILNAKRRNIDINLTKEEAYQKFLDQNKKCVYTGIELTFNSSSVKTDGSASLDRIDSTKGYTIDNIQWVHKKVNTLKMDLKEEDFIKICHLVSMNTKRPDDLIVDNYTFR